MLNSRSIDELRPDVAANCRTWLELCRDAGLEVCITGTVRDAEYQADCYRRGASKTPYPSFHAQGVGLAFDFCKNVKGREYGDLEFFRRAGELGEKIGFEWGGRWASFPDRPHLQWSQGGKYTGGMVRSGKYPPAMPRYEEEAEMTKEEIKSLVDEAVARSAQWVSPWASPAWEKAVARGVFDGTRPGGALTREQAAVALDRLGLLDGKEDM